MTSSEDQITVRLAEEFPGWTIWRAMRRDGKPGMWMATRHRKLSMDEGKRGLDATLTGNTHTELRKAFEAQVELGRRVAAILSMNH